MSLRRLQRNEPQGVRLAFQRLLVLYVWIDSAAVTLLSTLLRNTAVGPDRHRACEDP
jgi:hypothetical protein